MLPSNPTGKETGTAIESVTISDNKCVEHALKI